MQPIGAEAAPHVADLAHGIKRSENPDPIHDNHVGPGGAPLPLDLRETPGSEPHRVEGLIEPPKVRFPGLVGRHDRTKRGEMLPHRRERGHQDGLVVPPG
jgi:hypothetical protein